MIPCKRGLYLKKVQGFVFDTTVSNTGRLNAAFVLLEQSLEREILFLAYQHHIFELVLQGVFLEVKYMSYDWTKYIII